MSARRGGPSPSWNQGTLSLLRSGALASPRSSPAAAPPQPGHLRHHLCGPAGSAPAPPGPHRPSALPRPTAATRTAAGARVGAALTCAAPRHRSRRAGIGTAPPAAPPPPGRGCPGGGAAAAAVPAARATPSGRGGRAANTGPGRLPPLRPAAQPGPSPAPRPGASARRHAGWTLSWTEAPLQLNYGSE